MRAILPLLMILLITTFCSGQNGWTIQNSGTSTKLWSVSPVTLDICWATGFNTVLRTTNGGAAWSAVWDNEVAVLHSHTIVAVDANTAMVISCAGQEDNWLAGDTKIYRTTDAGANWQPVYTSTATGAFLNGMKMANATVGYAYGDPVSSKWVVLKTTNAGASWIPMSTAPGAGTGHAGMIGGFEVLTASYIWFGGPSRVFRSTDGGATWAFATYPFGSLISDMLFIDPNTGISGAINETNMGRTTDGGINWNSVPFLNYQNSVSFSSAGGDLFAVWGSRIFRSTNNGTSWDQMHSVTSGGFLNLAFLKVGSVLRGWAVGTTGMIHSYREGPVAVDGEPGNGLPSAITLDQNYPNPFNPTTVVRYQLPAASRVRLSVFDVLGREVGVLADAEKEAGRYEVSLDATGLAGGVYFYRLVAGSYVDTKRMLLLR